MARIDRKRAQLSMEPLERRELLDAAASLNFVGKVYQDLLNRSADAAGLTNFSNALNQGMLTRNGVALAIQASPEYRTDKVESIYSLLLHRPADPAGLNAVVAFFGAGGTPEQAQAILAGSAEYFQTRGGSTNDGFLNALYADLLQRSVDAGGRGGFDQLLAMGVSRISVAYMILNSLEYRQDLIQGYYQQFLHRAAEPAGLAGFVAAFQGGGTDATVVAAILSSPEYAPGDDPPNSDPVTLTTSPEPGAPGGEVGTLLQRAAAASASRDAIIAIVDRAGNVLGVRVEDGVSPTAIADPATRAFFIDGALAEARTAAFFANDSGVGTPLTSRTIRFISQTTITQREVMSSPDVSDPNSPLRGPGFVAPIGLGGHFPPGVAFTPQVDLFGIEHTNRDSLVLPGPDGVKGTADDITLPNQNRFNVPNQFLGVGPTMKPPDSYGVITNTDMNAQSRGIGTLPGGIPIFKTVGGADFLVGGIGVFFPGVTGFANEENSALDVTYNPAKRDRSMEAEFMAFAAVGGAPSAGFGVGALSGVPPLPEIVLPAGRLDLVGITLDVFGPMGAQGPPTLAAFGATLGPGDPNEGLNYPVIPVIPGVAPMSPVGTPQGAAVNTIPGSTVPEGWLVTPHDGTGLTAADVVKIVTQGIVQAMVTRAAIRLPLESTARMVFSVSDKNGNVLGLFRMPDATIFSIDVAVAKARNVAYYADPAQLQPIDELPGIPAGTAFTNRTFRFVSLPHFPEGIDTAPPAPFSSLNDPNTNTHNALEQGPPLPPAAYTSILAHDAFFADTNFHDPNNRFNQNGIVFFPGSVPLYKDVTGTGHPILVGGLGVSGDGVDQDDVVTFAASQGYLPPANVPTADLFFVNGVRLVYQKFNRNPQG